MFRLLRAKADAGRSLLSLVPLAMAGMLLGASCSAPAVVSHETVGTTTQAESLDSFGLGEGRSGALNVTAAGTIVNTYAPVVTVTSTTQITVGPLQGAAGPLAPGDLLMVWRTTGVSAASASQVTFTLGTDVAGYEFGRVKSVSAAGANTVVTFTNPLGSMTRYTTGSQVIRVPEYTTGTIAAAGGVVPYAWDGSSGGAVVFFATGTLTSSGSVVADGAGFRGGQLENAASAIAAPNCTQHDGSDEATPCGGAHKGEGIDPATYSLAAMPVGQQALASYGQGNYANGAGGGDARNAGGGGGGGFGLGGTGGNSSATDGSRAVGGLGGAPLSYQPGSGFVSLGGGGGAGDEDHGTGTAGGSGGGVVFVRAGAFAGTGTFSANGASVTAVAKNDGSGGGGAGGAVMLFSGAALHCSLATANGGTGGSGGSEPDGPGGGGGGGVVYVESSTTGCSLSAAGGGGGTTTIDTAYGATAGAIGMTSPGEGFAYGSGACTPALVATNQCGGCVADADCPTSEVCDTATNTCDPCTATEQGVCTGTTSACSATSKDAGTSAPVCVACNGNFGNATASAPCLGASSPHCITTGAAAGTCGSCLTGTDCTTAAAPACSTVSFSCVACNGDQGTSATAPCPESPAPYCQAAGTCGVCTTDADCVGSTHAGPRCDVMIGACGNTCTTDAICGAGQWCDNLTSLTGVCQAEVANGQPVPGGTCTSAVATRACVSGVCATSDNECGLPNGAMCASGDAGTAECRSGVCGAGGKCEGCASDSNCSGATPACSPSTSTCVACTSANTSACTGTTPLCNTSANTCGACTGDLGSSGAIPCISTSAPFCASGGGCGKCVNNTDCNGVGHEGHICDAVTGTCGSACVANSQCAAGQWCSATDAGAGTCMTLIQNGSPLPTSPAGLSTCTAAVAMEVCASGVCDPIDNKCGPIPPDAGVDAGSKPGDASLPGTGVSIEGGALSCAVVRGPGAPAAPTAPLSLFGLALGAAGILRRRRR